jgi:2-iminobutanoate/2-iminopropanoate deaminase
MKKHLNLPIRRPDLPFSDAVLVGKTLYISGRLGITPGTTTIPDDAAEEVRNLLDSIQSVLKLAKMKMSDLVYVQIFCPDVALFATFNQVYAGYFGKELPARAFIGSGPLLFGARFEMMGIAVKD